MPLLPASKRPCASRRYLFFFSFSFRHRSAPSCRLISVPTHRRKPERRHHARRLLSTCSSSPVTFPTLSLIVRIRILSSVRNASCPTVKWSDSLGYSSPYVFLDPALKEAGNRVAIFLQHHLVGIARQANVFELHIVRLYARLA